MATTNKTKTFEITSTQAGALYDALMKPLAGKTAKRALEANEKAKNMATCVVMEKPLKAARSGSDQEKHQKRLQAFIEEHKGQLTQEQLKKFIDDNTGNFPKRNDKEKFNKRLCINYTYIALGRIVNGFYVE